MPVITPRTLPLVSLLALTLAACSGGGDEDAGPAPTAKSEPTTMSLQGGPQAGGLGALPGNGGPGISGPGNAPGLGAPGNVPVPGAAQPASPGAGAYAAGRPGGPPAPGAAPAAGGDLVSMFTGKPSAGVQPSETIHGAGGVFAGLPAGWSSSDWNTDGYTDKCVYLFPKNQSHKHDFCLKQVTAEPNQTSLRLEAYAARWDKAEFEAPVDGKAGMGGYPAKIFRGKGTSVARSDGDRKGYAVWIQVPSKKNVLILGSWPVGAPELEQTFADVVKGVGPCTFKPQKGCVPDAVY